jgi:hypothetical protein
MDHSVFTMLEANKHPTVPVTTRVGLANRESNGQNAHCGQRHVTNHYLLGPEVNGVDHFDRIRSNWAAFLLLC